MPFLSTLAFHIIDTKHIFLQHCSLYQFTSKFKENRPHILLLIPCTKNRTCVSVYTMHYLITIVQCNSKADCCHSARGADTLLYPNTPIGINRLPQRSECVRTTTTTLLVIVVEKYGTLDYTSNGSLDILPKCYWKMVD